ncbi:FMN-binding split barrel [Cordyceps fumosorosea ARSEF 2679]|uniref:FMN-binding split barrel n=1 Tax=Cordyceps fumosorosea (strain ARSEF 2679) TaxID=1081104 RepID=A0A167MYQ5_CORFA|nr:FMN-binding split barrel [Cordyceps fumosorosea ARSEF 2679]OAA54916.1 FMN-binding split barrel [Cordyceps fumosorosea ARSEF 2679]
MYLRADHADADTATLRRMVRENPLGILTTAIPSDHFPMIQCSHIPFLLDVEDETDEAEQGILRGHMARANPHTKALIEAAQAAADAAGGSPDGYLEQEVMVLFNLPVQHYVTPKFYTETKPDSGKVVPTWNYAAAQVYGRIRVYHDTKSDAAGRFLARQISDLSDASERSIMGYTGSGSAPRGWAVTDAPERYIALLSKAIVGIEIRVDRLHGKFKMSQEMGEGDRAGVVAGFRALGTEMGARMSETVEERAALKKARKAAAQLAN